MYDDAMMVAIQRRRLGAVIAGGRATRFGSDKGAALLHDRPLIEHAADAIASWVDNMVVCGRSWPGYVALDDRPGPDLGPLGGLAAALHHARHHGFSDVLTTGCDMPAVPDDLLSMLIDGGSRYCAQMPILGCWDVALAPLLDAHLANGGRRSIRAWGEVAGAMPVDASGPIANINRPEDLDTL